MIGVSKLYCGAVEAGDVLRYRDRRAQDLPSHLLQFSADKKPVVVWNLTRRCNLFCAHCYSDSHNKDYAGELATEDALGVIDDLARFGVPVILFSGGEPLLRPDLFQLIRHAQARGIRGVIATNGTLTTPALAQEMKDLGLSYVGVSIDGPEHVHDKFRGKLGAFQESLRGIRACLDASLRVGIRVTLTRYNLSLITHLTLPTTPYV